jgi:hypothetical protein
MRQKPGLRARSKNTNEIALMYLRDNSKIEKAPMNAIFKNNNDTNCDRWS